MAENKNTSMGKGIILKVGKMGEGESMGTDLERTACFVEGTFDITNEDGEELELRCEGGRVVEHEIGDGVILITGEIMTLNDKSKFWKMSGNKLVSLNTDGFLSVELASDSDGTEGIKAPKCKVKAGVALNVASGWRIPIEIRVMKTGGDEGYYWEFFVTGEGEA